MTANQIESLRHLLYPLGLLPLIAFSTRFLIQWWKSEKQGRTVVPNIFWHFSIVGNTLLALHAFIQLHFPLYFLQIQQTTLAWRNLNLIGKSPCCRYSFHTPLHFAKALSSCGRLFVDSGTKHPCKGCINLPPHHRVRWYCSVFHSVLGPVVGGRNRSKKRAPCSFLVA
jgi:lipid-A-disaccharide synthase-like uncharacterized protein